MKQWWLVLAFLIAGQVQAVSSEFRLLVDLDNNSATGCTVSLPSGDFTGVETILTTRVATDGLNQANVVGVDRQNCVSGRFTPVQTVSDGGWPVGIGNGDDGFHVVETFLPIEAAQAFRDARIALIATDELGNSDSLLTRAPSSDAPIVLAGLEALPVPTLSFWLLLLLAVVLLGAGTWVIGRRGRVTLIGLVCVSLGTAAGAACLLDGEILGWGLADRLAVGSATDPAAGIGLRSLYGKVGEDSLSLCFRIDTALIFSSPPLAEDDAYLALQGETLDIQAGNGLLANDELGLPEAQLIGFGAGNLGGEIQDNPPGTTVSLGAGGRLTVDANGGLSFLAPTDQSGDFEFFYRLANISGFSVARVVIEVQSAPSAVGDQYEIRIDGALAIAAPGVLENDAGLPSPAVVSFGGGGLGGDASSNPAGTTVALGMDGSLQLDADGGLAFQPPSDGSGDFGFQYRIANDIGSSIASVTITINVPPSISSAANLSCQVTETCSLQIEAQGYPAPNISIDGDLPPGLDFNPETAELAGAPAVGSGAFWPLVITAANGITPDASQAFALTVNEAPTITSAATLACQVGTPCDFSFTADGFPAPEFDLPGLPAGLSLDPVTGVLSGTAEVGTGAVFALTLTAANGVAPDASQSFSLTIGEAPSISSAATLSCQVGLACAFTVTADGFPDPSFSLPGLPTGLTLDPTTGELSGTPEAGSGAEYALTLTAANGITPDASQAFALTVNEAPTITSAATLACQVGTPCDFSFTADGFPAPEFDLPGLPAGLSLDPVTGVLSGTAEVGTGGAYNLTLTASNGISPDATQSFTLNVGSSPQITSANSVECTVGSVCAFTFSADGLPMPAITVTGSLPAGVTFNATTNTLEGTPAVSSGGNYALLVEAANGILPNASQAFTLAVRELPGPLNDPDGDIPSTSSPGSTPYHGSFNTALVVSAVDGVLGNDALGFPAAAISTPAPTATNGTVALNPDGGFTYTPNAGFTGLDSFEYCLTNSVGAACATVSVAIGIRPAAAGATYPTTLIGNVPIDTALSSGLTVPVAGDNASVTLVGSSNGSGVVRANRSYAFTPNVGFTGAASLTYRVSNGFGNVDGVVSFNVGNGIWFVDNTQPAGDGRLGTPFNTLASALSQANGWPVFIATGNGNYAGGQSLTASRTLIGQPAAANLQTITGLTAPADSTLPAVNATRPVIANPGGSGLTLGSNNRLYSLQVSGSQIGLRGINVDGLVLNDVAVLNNGNALGHHGIFLSDPAGALEFTNVTASGNFQNNVLIDDSNNTGGAVTLTVSGGTFANNNSTNGDHGMLINVRGTAQWGPSQLSNATFSMNRVVGLLVIAGDSAQISSFDILNSSFQGNGTASGQQIGLDLSKALTSTMTVRVSGNSFTGHNSHAMNFFTAAGAGTGGAYNARIEYNVVGSGAVVNSGSRIGNCMRISMQGDSVNRVLISGNTLRQCPMGRGIEAISRNGTGGTDFTITNNNVNPDDTSGFPLAAIFVQSNAVTIPNSLRADISGNAVPAGSTSDIGNTYLGVVGSNAAVCQVVGNAATVTAQLTATNTGSASGTGTCVLIPGPITTPP